MEQDGRIVLRAESADEEALIMGGMKLGWKLLLRTKDTVIIREGYPTVMEANGEDQGIHKFELLEELPFSSSRQRMTILVRDTWDSKICMYSKGADTKIIPLSCDEEEMLQLEYSVILTFSPDGTSFSTHSSFMATPLEDMDEVEEERRAMLRRIAMFSKVVLGPPFHF